MRVAVAAVAAVAVVAVLGAEARADGGAPGVVVIKRPGIRAYEELVEEFVDHCRVRALVVTLDEHHPAEAVRASLHAGDVVFAIGQSAVDAVAGGPAHVVSAFAWTLAPGVIVADAAAPPELALRALKRARPSLQRVGVVYGAASQALVERAAAGPAPALGIVLVASRAVDGPSAVRALRRIAGQVDALWLPPDTQVVTPQLFQYALTLEIRRALPLAAVTRHQVRSGALLAWDTSPAAVGRHAAELAHALLAGAPPAALAATARPHHLELTVNGDAARRLGVDLASLRTLGARVE